MIKQMTITYVIGDKLYMNITNKCPCNCTFCIRNNGDSAYGSSSLWLEHEPSLDEILEDLNKHNLSAYSEIVFCGYGEPTCRLDIMLKVIAEMRKHANCPVIRLNTNGLSNLINGDDTAEIIGNSVDIVSISLNAGTEEEYLKVTRPKYKNAFTELQRFTRECVKTSAKVIMTVVDVISQEQIREAEKVCLSTGAEFRVRSYDS